MDICIQIKRDKSHTIIPQLLHMRANVIKQLEYNVKLKNKI